MVHGAPGGYDLSHFLAGILPAQAPLHCCGHCFVTVALVRDSVVPHFQRQPGGTTAVPRTPSVVLKACAVRLLLLHLLAKLLCVNSYADEETFGSTPAAFYKKKATHIILIEGYGGLIQTGAHDRCEG